MPWPPSGGLTSPTTVNFVPFRFELRPDLQRLPGRVGRGDERLAAALQEAARADLGGGHEAHGGIAELDAADRVRLALDVGLRRVEHLLQRLARRRDRGAEALHPLGEALRERAAVGGPTRRPCPPPRPPPGFAPRALPCRGCGSVTPSFARHAWIFACSAAVGGAIARFTSIRSPPVWMLATIFGTLPSWCTAWSVSPAETASTPSSSAISWPAPRERQLRARQEEVVDELRRPACRASRDR